MNLLVVKVLVIALPFLQATAASRADALVHELGTFPSALPGGSSSYGRPSEIEERRQTVYRQLRELDTTAAPALGHGLSDPDVRIRRGVALYLLLAGENRDPVTSHALDLHALLNALVRALRDPDERVKELSAQAVGFLGAAAAVAVPELVRLLEDPAEGLRNSACSGLAGIGPAARDALPALRKTLTDPKPDVRRNAQSAVDKIEAR